MNQLKWPTVSVFRCPECGHEGESKTFEYVDDNGIYCRDCYKEARYYHSKDADFVSVALYSCSRAYGGPEEGGWWYTTGTVCEEYLRNFRHEDEKEMVEYLERLWAIKDKENALLAKERVPTYDNIYIVEVHPNKMAPESFPENRPHYS